MKHNWLFSRIKEILPVFSEKVIMETFKFYYVDNLFKITFSCQLNILSLDCHFDYISHVNLMISPPVFLSLGVSRNINLDFSWWKKSVLTFHWSIVIVSDLSKLTLAAISLSGTAVLSDFSRWPRLRSKVEKEIVNLAEQSISWRVNVCVCVRLCDREWERGRECSQLANFDRDSWCRLLLETRLHVFVAILASEADREVLAAPLYPFRHFTVVQCLCHPGVPMKTTASPLPEVINRASSIDFY